MYMHLGHHSHIASSFVDLCTDNKISMHAYKYSYVATCVHIKYINSYTYVNITRVRTYGNLSASNVATYI